MQWVLKILRKHGSWPMLRVLRIDATTLEANASMKSLVRRDTLGVSYDDYLVQLAQAEGLANPTKEQLARG